MRQFLLQINCGQDLNHRGDATELLLAQLSLGRLFSSLTHEWLMETACQATALPLQTPHNSREAVPTGTSPSTPKATYCSPITSGVATLHLSQPGCSILEAGILQI